MGVGALSLLAEALSSTLKKRVLPFVEVRLQPLDAMSPFRRSWLTDRILIVEQPDFIDGLAYGNCV
jgi:hypothetical protein